MERLSQFLKRYGKRAESRYWIGQKPDVRDGQMVSAVLQNIGYPTTTNFRDTWPLQDVSWRDAATVLAFAAKCSLVHDLGRRPPEGVVLEASTALKDLDGTAKFHTNGNWGTVGADEWMPISTATFDAGLLGYDASIAFVFWVEEED